MAVAFTQTDFRFRNDDGSESTATWKAAVNTNITVDVTSGDVKVRVRLAAQEVGTTAATFAANLFLSKNGGVYAQVGAATSSVKSVDSTNLTDNAATTQQITAFTFVAGRVDDVDGTTTATASIVQNSGTEFEFMVQLVAADLANADTLDFRVYRSGVAITTYTNTGRVTITKSIKADSAMTEDADTLASASTMKAQAAGAVTEDADTLSGAAGLKIQGTYAVAEVDDALSGAGVLKIQAVSGLTEDADVLSATSTLSSSVITGSVSLVESDDTLSGSGHGPVVPQTPGTYNDFFFGSRERPVDTSPKFNPTLRERQRREEEEILIL